MTDSCAYDTTQDGLYYPNRVAAFDRFLHLAQAHSEHLPAYNSQVTDFDYCQAWWYASLSHLAYHDRDSMNETLRGTTFTLVDTVRTEKLFCYLARHEQGYVLAFRGTQYKNKHDAKTDINFPKTLLGGHNDVMVHTGFLRALDSAWPQIKTLLASVPDGVPLACTGHSLGAALAILCAQRIPTSQVYTFGAPKLGNDKFKRLCDSLNIHRVVLCADVVCMLPPKSLRYYAVGTEHFINAGDCVSTNPAKPYKVKQRLLAIAKYWISLIPFKRKNIGMRTLADHSIVNYANALWRLCHKQA